MPQDRTRRLAARVCVVLASVILPLGMLSSWVATVLSDTPSYVETVGPLASDPVVKRAAVAHLTRQAVKLVDVSTQNPQLGDLLGQFGYGEIGESLDDLTSGLADTFRPEIEATVRAIVVGVVESPTFVTAWREANRSAHQQLVDILEGRHGVVLDDKGRVSIELGTVLNSVTLALGQQGLSTGTDLPQVETSFSLIKGSDLEKARAAYRTLNALGFWLPLATLLLLVAALGASPRRWATLRGLGIGATIGTVVLLVVLAWVRSVVADSSGDPEVAKVIWDVLVSSLRASVFVALAVGVVAGVAGAWFDRPGAGVPTEVSP